MKHLLLMNLVLFVLVLAVAIAVLYLSRCRKRGQQFLLQQHADSLREGHWFRIRYASQTYYSRWIKFFPWNDSGILHVTAQTIRIYLAHDEVITIPVAQCRAQWLGLAFFPNGLVHWFSLQYNGSSHYLTSETGATVLNSQASSRAMFTQICEYLGNTLSVDTPTRPAATFAIEKNPYALSCVVLFFVLLLYFLVDNFFVLQEDYITWPSKLYFMIGGLVTLISAFLLMERGKVPALEKTVLALMLCTAMMATLYPGLRRINQLTDSEGLQSYTYTFSATRLLIPQDTGLPRIPLAVGGQDHDYWAQFKTGDSYVLQLRQGGLGIYQIDMAPVYSSMRDFYQLRSAMQKHATEASTPAVLPADKAPAATTAITRE